MKMYFSCWRNWSAMFEKLPEHTSDSPNENF